MIHQTYKEIQPDGRTVHVCCHQCDWRIAHPFDSETQTIGLYSDTVGGYRRISDSNTDALQAVQAGMMAGLVWTDRPKMQELMDDLNTEKHHWCLNRDCEGLPGGMCGISLDVDIKAD